MARLKICCDFLHHPRPNSSFRYKKKAIFFKVAFHKRLEEHLWGTSSVCLIINSLRRFSVSILLINRNYSEVNVSRR